MRSSFAVDFSRDSAFVLEGAVGIFVPILAFCTFWGLESRGLVVCSRFIAHYSRLSSLSTVDLSLVSSREPGSPLEKLL